MNTPKFKEGDWIKRKKDGHIARVVMLLKTCYSLTLTDGDGWWLDYDFQDNWELTDAPLKDKLEEAAEDFVWEVMENDEDGISELSRKLRPSSKISDFYDALAEFFKAGAEWQRKQDELTWEDIKRIIQIADSMLTGTAWDAVDYPDEQKYYEEVLKQYKEEKK